MSEDVFADDESFLDYCAIHSRTDRALFHADQVRRLADLAGLQIACSGGEWWALRADAADPLIEQARDRIEIEKRRMRDHVLAAGFVEGALET